MDIKYGKVCFKVSNNIVNNRQDAEECVNDAYLGVWNTIPPENPNPLLAYLCKIVRNISLKNYYRKKAVKRSSNFEASLQEIEDFLPATDMVEAQIEVKELVQFIENFLDMQTIVNRVIFMRRYWFSDSYKDIAAQVGLTEKNVSVRLTRIRRQMKEYLAEREVCV